MADNKKNRRHKRSHCGGFTLVELIVSVALFSLVFVAMSGAFLSVLDAYQKVTATQTSLDNLTAALESMIREMKTGYQYHCGSSGDITLPQDCPTGDTYVAFVNRDVPRLLGIGNANDSIVYKFVPCQPFGTQPLYCGRIQRSDNGGTSFYPVTVAPPALDITDVQFYVISTRPLFLGDPTPDIMQPQLTVIIRGSAGTKEKLKVPFSIQTTITQRKLDIAT